MAMNKTTTPLLAIASIVLAACGGGGGGDGVAQAPAVGSETTTGTNTPPVVSTPTTPVAQSYAYLVQAATNASSTTAGTTYTGGSIAKCALNASGDITACAPSGATGLNNPIAIAFSGSSAFILNQSAPKLPTSTGIQYAVLKCAVGTDGALSGCADTSPGVPTETDFAMKLLATANSGYALKEQQLLRCPSTFAGACGAATDTVSLPSTVVASNMLLSGNRMYVLNAGSGTNAGSVLSLPVDPASGALSGTSTPVTDASFASALRIDETTIDTPVSIAIKGAQAYVLTRYANKVVQCSYSETANTMTACTETKPLPALPGSAPADIVIQGSNAYITSSSATASGNAVVKCTIGATDGKLAGCAPQPGLTFSSQLAGLVVR